jgi:uncharacterized protein YceH (UPF0502 family)
MRLTAEQARVLGSLVEKQLATPQQYPLTLAALVAACNQTTNRDPVVDYDESAVTAAIDDLKQQKLARSVLPSHGRSAVRYRHILDETLALDSRQCALLAVLLLRGPQTIGELRTRTERMAEFANLDEVTHELEFLSGREEPLTANLGRRPGQKEERWDSPLLLLPTERSAWEEDAAAESGTPMQTGPGEAGESDLRTELMELRSEVSELRDELRALRASLGD